MKIESKFAVIISVIGLAVIIFGFYQWQYFEVLRNYHNYPDVSQFWISIVIGGILILYARNEWHRAKDSRSQAEWKVEHMDSHKKITDEQQQIMNEYKEVKQLANDVQLRVLENSTPTKK